MAEKKKQQQKSVDSVWYLFRMMWHYSEGNRKKLARIWGMLVCAETISISAPPLIAATILRRYS